jgi:hypothetical protein
MIFPLPVTIAPWQSVREFKHPDKIALLTELPMVFKIPPPIKFLVPPIVLEVPVTIALSKLAPAELEHPLIIEEFDAKDIVFNRPPNIVLLQVTHPILKQLQIPPTIVLCD